jgi:hypothetical protein
MTRRCQRGYWRLRNDSRASIVPFCLLLSIQLKDYVRILYLQLSDCLPLPYIAVQVRGGDNGYSIL